MGPLAICALICFLPALLADTIDSMERMGASTTNTSWWPV